MRSRAIIERAHTGVATEEETVHRCSIFPVILALLWNYSAQTTQDRKRCRIIAKKPTVLSRILTIKLTFAYRASLSRMCNACFKAKCNYFSEATNYIVKYYERATISKEACACWLVILQEINILITLKKKHFDCHKIGVGIIFTIFAFSPLRCFDNLLFYTAPYRSCAVSLLWCFIACSFVGCPFCSSTLFTSSCFYTCSFVVTCLVACCLATLTVLESITPFLEYLQSLARGRRVPRPYWSRKALLFVVGFLHIPQVRCCGTPVTVSPNMLPSKLVLFPSIYFCTIIHCR